MSVSASDNSLSIRMRPLAIVIIRPKNKTNVSNRTLVIYNVKEVRHALLCPKHKELNAIRSYLCPCVLLKIYHKDSLIKHKTEYASYITFKVLQHRSFLLLFWRHLTRPFSTFFKKHEYFIKHAVEVSFF